MGPAAPPGFNWGSVGNRHERMPKDTLMQSGKTLACIVCDERYKGIQHSECENKHCKCPQHIAEALEGIRTGAGPRMNEEGMLLDDWGKPVESTGGWNDSGSMIQHSLGHHISDNCAGFNHSVCGDSKCQCSCHDATDSKSRWQCPRCKFWVYEKMAKHCEACQRKVTDGLYVPTMAEQELAWARSLNPYPHKGPIGPHPKPGLVVLDDEADRKRRREQEAKGISKATDI